MVDLKSFDAPHWLRFGGIVKELYDVGVLPGVIRPMAIGFKTVPVVPRGTWFVTPTLIPYKNS